MTSADSSDVIKSVARAACHWLMLEAKVRRRDTILSARHPTNDQVEMVLMRVNLRTTCIEMARANSIPLARSASHGCRLVAGKHFHSTANGS